MVLHFSTFLLETVLPKNLIPPFLEGIIITRNTGVSFWDGAQGAQITSDSGRIPTKLPTWGFQQQEMSMSLNRARTHQKAAIQQSVL